MEGVIVVNLGQSSLVQSRVDKTVSAPFSLVLVYTGKSRMALVVL